MKRKGPCSHCGINSTPLWRQGPTGKPVLCNACGSRYKSKGTLENYLPKNAHPQLSVNNNVGKAYDRSNLSVGDNLPKHVPFTGGINTNLWNIKIPSRKRSAVVRKRMTPMERFQKQLLNLWKSMGQPNESSPEDILLFDNNVNNFIPRNEIGLGCTLLKTDVTSTNQHHSDASSSIKNRPSILCDDLQGRID